MFIMLKGNKNNNRKDELIVGSLPQRIGECLYDREETTMTLIVENDHFRQDLSSKRR